MEKRTTVINFTEFFKEERDVWVKSIIPGQVSLQFDLGPGNTQGICVPFTGDPINLTDRIPFAAVKNSPQLRTLCNPRRVRDGVMKPAALQLLTTEEATEHFKQKATRKGLWLRDEYGNIVKDDVGNSIPDVELAQMKANEAARPNIVVPPPVEDDEYKPKLDMHVVSPIQPRVLWMVNQVSETVEANERWDADRLLTELEAVEATLKLDDLKYIRDKGFFKSIKSWAETRIAALEG